MHDSTYIQVGLIAFSNFLLLVLYIFYRPNKLKRAKFRDTVSECLLIVALYFIGALKDDPVD